MKRSLLALAVLSTFAGAASAQSSVTIYGVVDLAVMKGNGGTAPNPGAPANSKAWNEAQSRGSRLGFQGNEDLGNGLSAQFQIEHRFTPDNGEAGTPFWGGRSYVQLSSASAGRVYLGREYAPAFWPAFKSDPFAFDGVGQEGTKMWAGFVVAGGGIRPSNSVGYRSPNLSGVTVQAAAALGEGVTNREVGFNVEYSAGPIYAALGYEKLTGGPAAAAATEGNALLNLAFHYNFGMVKPIVYYGRAKVGGGTLTNKFFSIGALAPVGPGNLKAMYYRLTPDDAAATNGRETKFGVGYDYMLSKRTTVYADVGLARKADDAAGTTYTSSNVGAFGLRHVF